MNLELKDRPTVIVGAARGIGRAIAEAFAEEGAVVGLIDRDERVTETANEISCASATADVTDYEALSAAAQTLETSLGPVEHVVFAVGAGSGKFGFPFWNLDPADWKRVIDVNLMGAVNAAHVFLPSMCRRGEGTFLFLSSVAGQIGSQTDPPYSAAKAALINFAQCAAKDAAGHGVRVNVVAPGMVKTDLNRSVWQSWHDRQPESERQTYEEWAAEKIGKLTPLRRWQEPADIAAAAVFLASPKAKNITGQTVNVDGGWVMH